METLLIDPRIQQIFDSAKKEVEGFLPPLEGVDEARGRELIQKYVAAIEGNFVAWMGAAAICARSPQGRFAAEENLWVEMKDDHAGMLRVFAVDAKAEPEAAHYRAVASGVQVIRGLVAEMSGLKTLTLMGVLENTSGVFIPFLDELAKKLGSTNRTYAQIHGEADIAHANQFVWAVQHEMAFHEDSEAKVRDAVSKTLGFLKMVFVL
jgi:hypothetical protein